MPPPEKETGEGKGTPKAGSRPGGGDPNLDRWEIAGAEERENENGQRMGKGIHLVLKKGNIFLSRILSAEKGEATNKKGNHSSSGKTRGPLSCGREGALTTWRKQQGELDQVELEKKRNWSWSLHLKGRLIQGMKSMGVKTLSIITSCAWKEAQALRPEGEVATGLGEENGQGQ